MTAYLDHKDLTNETIDPARKQEIQDGVKKTLDRLHEAEQEAGRPEGSVMLLAATKTRDAGEIAAALAAGITTIGENRPQEVQIKAPVLERIVAADPSLAFPDFHLIGQLQKNKINKVLPYVGTIESVESAKEAHDIAIRVPGKAPSGKVRVLLEVNESGEASKSGCDPEAAYDEALRIAAMEGIELAGLMTIGAHVSDEHRVRAGFAALRDLRERILASKAEGTASCTTLSMGMTHDLELAVAEGSTQVRVGTGIFGARAFI